jgi:signal transduction histidine kinase
MKVLIVDDNPTNRKLLRVNLEGEGIETIEAEDGIDALQKLETEKVDAIISDILMPRMDGYRLCQEVRTCTWLAGTPFIFYTSTYTSLGDEKLAMDCGADRYIKKPAPLSNILMTLLELTDSDSVRPVPMELPEELHVMREYAEALVRKLEERNTKLERARAEIMRTNAGLERRVQERTAELLAANQELEAFSRSLAHDLRSPLMAIDGFSHILLQECEGRVPDKAIEHLRYISQAARRMNELTSDLLRLSRASRAEIHRESVDLSMLARGIIQDLREAHPERKVAATIMDGIKVQADMALLRIALENLLGNAWKFTSKAAEPEIEVGVNGERTYYVRDNGAGFDMAHASRLFGAFQRLHSDSDFPGTGIGLTTVERIVRRHGGQIRAESAPGRGATFLFDLGTADHYPGNSGAAGGPQREAE